MGAVKCWPARKWSSGGLERCTVAALADAHKVINKPNAKTDRIAVVSSVRQADHVRTGGHGPKL